jgi:hypothetical protein
MPSYNNYWIKHIEKDSVTQPVRTELNNILKAAGVKESDASALVDDIHGPLSQTVAFDNSIDRQNINMHDMAAKFFKDSYAAIDKANLSPKNRIVTAQRIADVMLRNYSPVTFVNGELDAYADSYVVNDSALLQEQLQMLGDFDDEKLEQLTQDAKAALDQDFIEEEPAPEEIPDPRLNAEEAIGEDVKDELQQEPQNLQVQQHYRFLLHPSEVPNPAYRPP